MQALFVVRSTVKLSEFDADDAGVRAARAILLSFLGSFAWFIWTVATQHTQSACYGYGHYAPRAGIALTVIAAADLALCGRNATVSGLSSGGHRTIAESVLEIAGTVVLTTFGLWLAALFAGAISCSGG